jgi:uncharacterized membrane protein
VLLTLVSETTRLILVVLTLGGWGFSAYLTYRELFSIHAICPWCVSSAIIMTFLAPLAVWRFLRGDDARADALSQGAGEPDAATSAPPSVPKPLPDA